MNLTRTALTCLVILLIGNNCARTSMPAVEVSAHPLPDSSLMDPVNPDSSSAPGKNTSQTPSKIPNLVLLFNGAGISTTDWQSTESILKSMGVPYQLINSSVLNMMSLDELKNFSLILIPGGDSNVIHKGLTQETRIRIRQAVRDGGVSYLGICAGAWAGVGIDALSNTTAYFGFAVAQGDYLKFWYPNQNVFQTAALAQISFADGSRRHLMWWGGPATPDWKGGVVAKYPDGRAAISQAWNNKGLVIVSGPHPEAPASWQYTSGTDPDGTDFDIAIKLIRAALDKKPLPVFAN
jgi:glutamine amidotransferase-like uncharacterized protein